MKFNVISKEGGAFGGNGRGTPGTAAHFPIAHTPNTFATAVKGKAAAPVG